MEFSLKYHISDNGIFYECILLWCIKFSIYVLMSPEFYILKMRIFDCFPQKCLSSFFFLPFICQSIGLSFVLSIFLSERCENPLTPDCSRNYSVDQNIIPTAKSQIYMDTTPVPGEIYNSNTFQGDTFDLIFWCGNAKFISRIFFVHVYAI